MTIRTGSTCWAILRGPLPRADLALLRVFVEWRRQGSLYGLCIKELACRSGYDEGTLRRLLSGLQVHHRERVIADVADALGLIPLKDNEGGYPRGTGCA